MTETRGHPPRYLGTQSGWVYAASVVVEAVTTIALLLLAASGIAKIRDPEPTSRALQGLGASYSTATTTALAFAEIATGLFGLLGVREALIGAAALYAGFAIFVGVALRRDLPIQSCGCFGRDDTPPTIVHIIYNSAAFAALVIVFAVERSPIPWHDPIVHVLLYLFFAAIGAFASYLLLSRLPLLFRAAVS